jgi:hypothetical protein
MSLYRKQERTVRLLSFCIGLFTEQSETIGDKQEEDNRATSAGQKIWGRGEIRRMGEESCVVHRHVVGDRRS